MRLGQLTRVTKNLSYIIGKFAELHYSFTDITELSMIHMLIVKLLTLNMVMNWPIGISLRWFNRYANVTQVTKHKSDQYRRWETGNTNRITPNYVPYVMLMQRDWDQASQELIKGALFGLTWICRSMLQIKRLTAFRSLIVQLPPKLTIRINLRVPTLEAIFTKGIWRWEYPLFIFVSLDGFVRFLPPNVRKWSESWWTSILFWDKIRQFHLHFP